MPVTPDLQEAEAGRVQVQHLSGLKFKAGGDSPRPCVKIVKAGDVAPS